jgi:alkanesulfonate monooxygenase SsuD/methylene tetrahydromethanopterin reductase-like flavin-dependent oxidoreductase (luciferase family)
VRLFPDVANLPLRPPAMLAKAAASLDLLSGGRLELGLGAGAFWDAIKAMGGPVRSRGEAVDALEEAIAVIQLMWCQARSVKFEGRYYSVRGVHPGPAPAHSIGLWIGAYGPRMLRLIGRRANGWVPSLSYLKLEQANDLQRRIDDAASEAGRDPADITRVLNLSGAITDGESRGLLQGPVRQWVDDLTRLTLEFGFDSYLFGGAPDRALERFAQEVVPQVRQQVARERARAQGAVTP